MRWFWIDRYLEFVHKSHALAIKNVSLSEPYVLEYYRSFAAYPPSLIIEGMAQAAGLLVNQTYDFKRKVVLAKISKSVFHEWAFPGDQLLIRVDIENMQEEGSVVKCSCRRNDELLVEADLMFAYADDLFEGGSFFDDAGLSSVLRSLRIFDVGQYPDGTRIEIPAHFLQAEKDAISDFYSS